MIFTDFVCNWTFECQTSKHNYHCFSSCTFSRTVIVNAGLFPIQTFTSHTFPCKIAQTRNQTKKQHLLTLKATRSQEHSPLKHHQPTRLFWHVVTGTLCRFASSYSLLYFLEFEWLLFFLKQESLPIISKGKSYLKLSKLIPNWTISD